MTVGARMVLLTLAALLALAPAASARRIPEGAAVWFACTQPAFDGPPSLRCQQPYDPRYGATFLRGFDRLTPENEFKMAYLEPQQGSYDFSVADQVAGWARAHGKGIRGHTLVWDKQLPTWLSEPLLPWSHDGLLNVMRDYISNVVGHFRSAFPGVVGEWDVVNEPIDPAGGFDPSPWMNAIGPSYVGEALRAARGADPGARLVINQLGADQPGPVSRRTLALATGLRRAGYPLDAVGLQGHVTPDNAPSLGYLLWLMRRYASIGLQVEITELDLNNDGLVDDPVAKAEVFRRYALACRISANCTGYTVWGVADRYSWLGSLSDTLLYSSDFAAKPQAAEVRALLNVGRAPRSRPRRKPV